MKDFKAFISDFEKRLSNIIVDGISPELYCRKYLSHLVLHKKYYLAIYADVLNKLIQQSSKVKEEILLIDFGAGNGLLGIFAKCCGFKKVIINDIDDKFVNASRKLAEQLDIKIDGFITGDINSVQSYFKNDMPDAVIATDVIEHIYDLDGFFAGIKNMNPSMITVFTTASNPFNPFKVNELKKIQMKDELKGGDPGDHILFGESPLEPFLKIREQVIKKNYPALTDKEISILATETRGMVEHDIIAAVDKYKLSGKLPVPANGLNTCNPLNGSWTERILSPEAYFSLYSNAGFTCKFYAGFYNDYEGGLNSFAKKMLNAGITTFGKRISPYIVIVGFKK